MFWRMSQIIAILIFLVSVIQLYREPNIGYLIIALSSFASLMTWLKGPVILAAEKLNDPNMEVVKNSIERLKEINNWSSRWELSRTMSFHKNSIVRRKATIALAEIGDKRAFKGAMSHMSHPEMLIALSNMNEINDRRVISILANTLNDLVGVIGTSTELTIDWKTSLFAVVRCFGKTKEEKVVKELVSLFGHIERVAGFREFEIEIIDTLGKIGGEDAKEFLISLYKGGWLSPHRPENEAIVYGSGTGGRFYKYDKNVQTALRRILTDSGFEKLASSVGYRDGSDGERVKYLDY